MKTKFSNHEAVRLQFMPQAIHESTAFNSRNRKVAIHCVFSVKDNTHIRGDFYFIERYVFEAGERSSPLRDIKHPRLNFAKAKTEARKLKILSIYPFFQGFAGV